MDAIDADVPRALYFLYFQVQDPDWLKVALLYWEGLRLIAP